MRKNIIGIMVIGLVIALILPIGSATLQKTDEPRTETDIYKPASQLQITLRGGLGLHVSIKNTGTTDIHISEMKLKLDGAKILYNSDSLDIDIAAGKTKHVIYVVSGFGATNIDLTLDTITQTASGKVLFWFVYGVE